jgi:predicted DNA-binding helix-hairpin-helix protein
MFYNNVMDGLQKIARLGEHVEYESAEETAHPSLERPPAMGCKPAAVSHEFPVYWAALPNGQRAPLLKSLLTSACENNCNYCSCRCGRDFQRLTLSPDEMAQSFMNMYRGGLVKGMFLSSGIAGGGIRTQDRLLAAAEILRLKYHFKGYIHLKIMPGVEHSQVVRAMQLSNRVSINLEAPNEKRLPVIAPVKKFAELLQPLQWVDEIRRSQFPAAGWEGHWPSTVTQVVAGGSGERDVELLQTAYYLHQQLHLARVYFSGFKPVHDTPMENQAPIDPTRQNRLYQADFLLRDYGFSFEDLPFDPSGDLPLKVDPKLAWAMKHIAESPIEINRAGLEDLMRIPGFGPAGAKAIIRARQKNTIHCLDDLKAIGLRPARALPFILMDGRKPPVQPKLLGFESVL